MQVGSQRLSFLETQCQVDRVLHSYTTSGYSDFVVTSGGDVTTYRVRGSTPSEFEISIR